MSRSEDQLNNISNTLGATPATDRYSRVENQVKGIMDKIGIEEQRLQAPLPICSRTPAALSKEPQQSILLTMELGNLIQN